ncbi:hypothetical protein B0H17DRAFT_199785 [Mycena rosella]|uniref:Uncharacterized protein n=1 Tax=Mycena rosella TaxID=1033263 RepID=A0AAD7DYG0_MYCRO|nr:hypothetical protein B0H17DRAFT_199785 [Mycena rosella]
MPWRAGSTHTLAVNRRFADIRELMALIGVHSTGKQRSVNTAVANSSFDSTVDTWDIRTLRVRESLQESRHIPVEYDVNFSHNATTQKDCNRFVGNQENWGQEYATAHEKMSLLGLEKRSLTECTETLPQSIDLKNLSVSSYGSGKAPTDPTTPSRRRSRI